MIRFSFSSFYMSLIFANIMILFLYITFHSEKLMIKLGLPILSSAVLLTILRMALPFEFLFLSHNIYFPKAASKVIGNVTHPYISDHFSVWTCIKVIWIIGIIFFGIRFWKEEHALTKEVEFNSRKLPDSAPAYRVFRQIQQEFPKAKRIELRTFSPIQTPAIFGLRRPYILLPEELPLDDEQLYYILRHEVSHYLHHDSLLKICVRLLCILYWWNPLCKFLQEKTDIILEMHVDRSLTKNSDQKTEYIECLIFVAKYIASSSPDIESSRIISFCGKPSSTLAHRFQMIMKHDTKPFYKSKKCILLLCFTGLFLLSYIFIFEASYITPEDSADSIILQTDNLYFIKREDGQYDMYINGKYIGIESSLEYYPDDTLIYEEEVTTHEKN